MSRSHHRPSSEILLLVFITALSLYAVLAYGLTTVHTREIFDVGLAVLIVLWIIGLVIQKRLPRIPWIVWAFPLAIVAYGWISVLNAEFIHEWENGGEFIPSTTSWGIDWLFGTVDISRSLPTMLHLSLSFGGFWVLCDLARSRTNRRHLVMMVASIGLVIALIGIFQKASGTQTMLFFDEPLTARRFFASYRYHGNAATLLNFAWPLAFVLLLRAKVKDLGPFSNAVWGAATFFLLAAVFINTSKIGHVLGIAMLALFVIFYRKTMVGLIRSHPRPVLAGSFVGVIVLGLIAGLVALSFSTSLDRWSDFQTSFEARIKTYEVCMQMIASSGLWGNGPGVFSSVFPYHAAEQGLALDVFWHTAHQDYLQTLIEWGYFGAALWFCFIGSLFFRGLLQFRRGDFYAGAIVIGLFASLIQAIVDFPAQIPSLQWVALILLALINRTSSSAISKKVQK